MENNYFLIIFLIFVAFTARDILVGHQQRTTSDNDHNSGPDMASIVKKEIPSMTLKAPASGPTLKILYCYSCGYKRAFDEYSHLISERFPQINIIGDNYSPGLIKNKVVQLLSVLKLVIIALLMANVNPFQLMGVPTPGVWFWMTQHKMYACLMLFFLSNTIESHLMSSGAFEIYYNDVPVWSKITTGRIPSPPEMFEIIENQNKLYANQMNMNIDFNSMPLPGRPV
ncbi:thioredoxin reductase-like selenoprotein T [Oppia nitens]|uniref:thioredoxin reductase-like selenoprotein T n=1 Tax=Oppia nitens TaxID=1686743 RepID=UPI0023D986EA|nr:thioredoxin reductase-like selenoprotein T [Oppia nitens]